MVFIFVVLILDTMPFKIRKNCRTNKYRVTNATTGKIHAYATSLHNARRQVRLMRAVDHGFRVRRNKNR